MYSDKYIYAWKRFFGSLASMLFFSNKLIMFFFFLVK